MTLLIHCTGVNLEIFAPKDILEEFDTFLVKRQLQFTGILVGGAAVALGGYRDRMTADIDLLTPIPEPVKSASREFAKLKGLSEDWFNNRLKRFAAFQNPEFYKAQAMRMPTYKTPRVIGCADDFDRHIGLPRGLLDELRDLLTEHRIGMDFIDERPQGKSLNFQFHAELRAEQAEAISELMKHDIGVLSATTAFGKTVVGAWMIAARKTNTLILVHRQELLDQWRERLATFLGVDPKAIGQIGGGKTKPNGLLADLGRREQNRILRLLAGQPVNCCLFKKAASGRSVYCHL